MDVEEVSNVSSVDSREGEPSSKMDMTPCFSEIVTSHKVEMNTVDVVDTKGARCFELLKSIHSIKDLDCSSRNVAIKARVMSKSRMIPPSGDRRIKTFFNVDLIDQSGEIRMVVFKEDPDETFYKLFDKFEVNSIYYFSNFKVDKAYEPSSSPIENHYELIFNDTDVCKCEEVGFQDISYDFVPLDKVQSLKEGTFVDIIGICVDADDVVEKYEKGVLETTRNIELSDASGNTLVVHLRGPAAERFSDSDDPVVAIKNGYVTPFEDYSTGTIENRVMADSYRVNPNLKEVSKLLEARGEKKEKLSSPECCFEK